MNNFKWKGNSKRWRQCIHVHLPTASAIFSREYPSKADVLSKGIRNFYEKHVAEFFNVEDAWKITSKVHRVLTVKTVDNYVYNDVSRGDIKKVIAVHKSATPALEELLIGEKVNCVQCYDEWAQEHMTSPTCRKCYLEIEGGETRRNPLRVPLMALDATNTREILRRIHNDDDDIVDNDVDDGDDDDGDDDDDDGGDDGDDFDDDAVHFPEIMGAWDVQQRPDGARVVRLDPHDQINLDGMTIPGATSIALDAHGNIIANDIPVTTTATHPVTHTTNGTYTIDAIRPAFEVVREDAIGGRARGGIIHFDMPERLGPLANNDPWPTQIN
jgi:hypothetical protein